MIHIIKSRTISRRAIPPIWPYVLRTSNVSSIHIPCICFSTQSYREPSDNGPSSHLRARSRCSCSEVVWSQGKFSETNTTLLASFISKTYSTNVVRTSNVSSIPYGSSIMYYVYIYVSLLSHTGNGNLVIMVPTLIFRPD